MNQTKKSHLTYEVPYADTDRMGIIYYANYLVFFERIRTRILADLGYPYPQLEADGIGLPVIEAHVEYKASATYGDILDFYGWLADHIRTRLRVRCEVWKKDLLLARGYTVHAGFDLIKKKPARFPDSLLAKLM